MFYRLVRRAFLILAGPMFRFRVRGAGHVPRAGPAILVAAHRSWLDPACVGAACGRPVRFLIMRKVYEVGWARWFYRAMRTIAVGGGSGTVGAMREALRSLEAGEVVGVFPEGRVLTGPLLGPVRGGVGLLAVRSRAPVVPLHIKGSARAWPHRRALPGPAPVEVSFGTPIDPPGGDPDQAAAELMDRIEAALNAFVASEGTDRAERRGAYGGGAAGS